MVISPRNDFVSYVSTVRRVQPDDLSLSILAVV